jgi:hypothetical protein
MLRLQRSRAITYYLLVAYEHEPRGASISVVVNGRIPIRDVPAPLPMFERTRAHSRRNAPVGASGSPCLSAASGTVPDAAESPTRRRERVYQLQVCLLVLWTSPQRGSARGMTSGLKTKSECAGSRPENGASSRRVGVSAASGTVPDATEPTGARFR